MTLCKFREERKYDAQFLIDRHDARGLLKMLDEAVGRMGEEGLASTRFYAGAYLGFKTLFECAERDGGIDKWTDFMCLFEQAIEELEGE